MSTSLARQTPWRWRAAAVTVIGLVTLGPAGGATAAEPAPIGADSDYRTARYWSSGYSTPAGTEPEAAFSTPTGAAFGVDGSMYLISSYSSGSSRLVEHVASGTGELLGAFSFDPTTTDGEPGYDYSPTGIWASPDGTVWVVGSGPDSILAQFSATGTELARYPLSPGSAVAGLVGRPDGTFTTIRTDLVTPEIVTIDVGDATVQSVPLPGVEIGSTAFQLNLTEDGSLLWGSGDDVIHTMSADGSGAATYDTPGIFQATLGADGNLYTTDQNGTVRLWDTANLDTPGVVIAERDTPAYLPVQPMSTTGVTAGPDGTLYVLGYFYGDPSTGLEPFQGVTALTQVHSPSVSALDPAVALTCRPVGPIVVTATGTPAPTWFEVVDGSLPAGLSLDQSTGTITGTPTVAGTSTATVRADNGVDPTASTTTLDTVTLTVSVALQQLTVTTPPAVTGTPEVGSTLTVTPGGWQPEPAGRTYQWLRDGVPLDGATDPTYTLVAADAGRTVAVATTGSGDCTSSLTTTSAAVSVSPAGGPDDPTTTPSASALALPAPQASSPGPGATQDPTSTPVPVATVTGTRLASTGGSGLATLLTLSTVLVVAGALTAVRRRRTDPS